MTRKRQTEDCEIYAKDLVPRAEWNAQRQDLLRSGWTRREAHRERRAMEPERKLNQTPTCIVRLCEQYVCQSVGPGDIVVTLESVFNCGAEVQALAPRVVGPLGRLHSRLAPSSPR